MAENALREAGCSITVDGEVYISSTQVGNFKKGVFTTLPIYVSKAGVEKDNETIITESIMKKELDRWAIKRGLSLVQKEETTKSGTHHVFSLGTYEPRLMGTAVEGYQKFRDCEGYDLAGKIEKKTEKKVKEALRLVRENLPKLSKEIIKP